LLPLKFVAELDSIAPSPCLLPPVGSATPQAILCIPQEEWVVGDLRVFMEVQAMYVYPVVQHSLALQLEVASGQVASGQVASGQVASGQVVTVQEPGLVQVLAGPAAV
ncbi:hypothetical protein, partial [Rodentibacter pneumotropicus]|uniref:hypothetical protein n=1 Tax=Rodentibacter pneumotropicus TaxID=758 RepID=UPI001F45C3FF